MCSGSGTGSYSRLIDFVYHSNLLLRVIKKKDEFRTDEKAPTGDTPESGNIETPPSAASIDTRNPVAFTTNPVSVGSVSSHESAPFWGRGGHF